MKEIILPENYKYISAFLTFRCQLNCSFCLNAFDKSFNRKRDEISGEKWVDGLNRIISAPNIPITFSGGEPFIHKDFIYIINNLKPELKIDILTNLHWGKEGIERFIEKVNPKRLKRNAPYASIRVSYHPEQMGNGLKLAEDAKKLQDAEFSIGIWSVLYPSSEQLSAINKMQFICREKGIDFRLKEFTGEYMGQIYGNYSKYPNSAFSKETKRCLCRTSELLIAPNASVYRCHKDLFAAENPIGNLLDASFDINNDFKPCSKYGLCHPCDVKIKTNYKQELGHTSVEIMDIR